MNYDQGEDTDEWALSHGYVSVVPVQYDLTAHHSMAYFNQKWQLPHTLSPKNIQIDTSDTFNNLG